MKIYILVKVNGSIKEVTTSKTYEGMVQLVECNSRIDIADDSKFYLYGTVLDLEKPKSSSNLLIASGTIKEVNNFLRKNLR
jgi:hypothetical protein